MTASQNAEALLTDLEQVRTVVLSLREQLDQLQTLPQAQAAYEAELGQETRLKQNLEQQIEALQSERSRLQGATRRVKPPPVIKPGDNPVINLPNGKSPNLLGQPSAARSLLEEERQARRRLEFVRRFASRLGAQNNLAQINAILSDPSQPRGAVLFLVDWATFTQPLPNETNQEKYLERLRESIAALLEYQARLKANIDTLKIQYGGLLGVWEVWCTRENDPLGWEDRIEQTRAIERSEIAKLQAQKAKLEDEIAALRGQNGR